MVKGRRAIRNVGDDIGLVMGVLRGLAQRGDRRNGRRNSSKDEIRERVVEEEGANEDGTGISSRIDNESSTRKRARSPRRDRDLEGRLNELINHYLSRDIPSGSYKGRLLKSGSWFCY